MSQDHPAARFVSAIRAGLLDNKLYRIKLGNATFYVNKSRCYYCFQLNRDSGLPAYCFVMGGDTMVTVTYRNAERVQMLIGSDGDVVHPEAWPTVVQELTAARGEFEIEVYKPPTQRWVPARRSQVELYYLKLVFQAITELERR